MISCSVVVLLALQIVVWRRSRGSSGDALGDARRRAEDAAADGDADHETDRAQEPERADEFGHARLILPGLASAVPVLRLFRFRLLIV